MFSAFSRTLTRRQMAVWCTALAAALLLSGLHAGLGWARAQQRTAAVLCADTLRLHIRADSDSLADQTAKLAVRDAILAYVDRHCTASTQADALRWAARNLTELEWAARSALARRGIVSTVNVRLVEMYFPTTRYAASALPAGRYQALRIDIGAAPYGRNWWCVLYPGLCRTACGGYAAPAENDLVCGRYLLRFKCVEWWQKHTARREDVILLG